MDKQDLAALERVRQRYGLGPVTEAEKERALFAGTPVGAEADRLYDLAQRFRLGIDWGSCLRAAQLKTAEGEGAL